MSPHHPGPRLDATAPRRVLVADTDPDSRSLCQSVLSGMRCDFIEAADGREALTKALVRVPALLITELKLPILDGYALCEILRQDRTTAHVPIIVATAAAAPHGNGRIHDVADIVLTKPTSSSALRQACERLLDESRLLHERVRASLATAEEVAGESATNLAVSLELRHGPRSRTAAKRHSRYTTTTPPNAPPALTCPLCAAALQYEVSFVGGVNKRLREQWDYLACGACGSGFQYRQRTRRMRPLSAPEQLWLTSIRRSRK